MKLILVLLLFFSFTQINAEDFNPPASQDTNLTLVQNDLQQTIQNSLPKVLYISYHNTPQRVLKGEIFTITIKALSTVSDFTDITYALSNSQGLKLLSRYPTRDIDDKYYYETFHFLVTDDTARLPDIEATLLNYNEDTFRTTTLIGKQLNVVALNPKKNFANILANSFELLDYRTTSYDEHHNIVVFSAIATNCDIASFKLQNVFKQGNESIIESYFDSKITYYAVIDKDIQNFSFSYFDLKTNRFKILNIPIVVDDDSVTTQSDLKPKDQSHQLLKMQIASAIAFVSFLIILWRRKYIYLVFIIIPISYIVYIGTPSKEICIKQGSKLQILPVENGTIFETTPKIYHLQKEGETKGFTKIKLQNDKIGWVKNEDICTP